jgi:quercetin dioxygenase-like cupin family protein
MRKMAILREDEIEAEDAYPVPVSVSGLVWSKLLSPREYVLWLCLSELEAGAQMTWPTVHSDEALYVFSGALDVGGHGCPERGAVIIESDVPATITATQRTRIAHWGSWETAVPEAGLNGPLSAGEHRIHVIGPNGRTISGSPEGVGVRSFANSACETCRVSLFEVTRTKRRPGRPHSHSADEIIFLVDGTIELGSYTLQPGTSLCIPGSVRYAEGSGDDGAVFINYRREASDRTDFVKGQPPSTAPESRGARDNENWTNDVVDVAV